MSANERGHRPRTDADRELYTYLAMIQAMQQRQTCPARLVYRGISDFLIQHGRFWTPAPRPAGFARLTPARCFDNAFQTALASEGALRYVEGYATGMIAVHHAWVVWANGEVIEQTFAEPGASYCGVVFPLREVLRARAFGSASVFGLVEVHAAGERIYTQPFQEQNDGHTVSRQRRRRTRHAEEPQ